MKENKIIHIDSISELHKILGFDKPKHSLITLIDAQKLNLSKSLIGIKTVANLYMIALKDRDCGIEYGRNHFDLTEGVMVFSEPKQVNTIEKEILPGDINGWLLYFHPDLIRGTNLGDIISEYSFLSYSVYEALHLSDDEEKLIDETMKNIQNEFTKRIDNHTHRVISSNIELLLNLSSRFYERQFNTRTTQNKDVLSKFERAIKDYFSAKKQLEHGLPSVEYFAEKMNLSTHYFSDVLKKETGRSAKDHINDFVIELAKNQLAGNNLSISEVAYNLGFNYPHYFTRLFKNKTGYTPSKYRQQSYKKND